MHGFPVRRLLRRLRPLIRPSPVCAARSAPSRAAGQGSHVPAVDLRPLGGVLYPWRCGTTAVEEIAVVGTDTRPHQSGTSSPTGSDRIGSQPHPAEREQCVAQDRGFRCTLCRLAIGRVVARHAEDGGARYSSVRQLFPAPSQPGALGQTPSLRAPSRIGPHCSGRSTASRQEGAATP